MKKNQRPKVLHIITGLKIGGAETALSNVVMKSKGIDHVVISLGHLDYYGKKLKKLGFIVIALELKPSLFFLNKLIRLHKIIKFYSPDIVHTWLPFADFIGGLVAKFSGVKKIYWSIVNDYMPANSNFRNILAIRLLAFLSKYIPHKIISCSEIGANNHILAGYKRTAITFIPLGVCTNTYKPDKELGLKVRKRLNLNNKDFLIGMIARFHPNKDYNNLLKSLSILKDKSIKFKCLLVGRGISSKNKFLWKLIKTLGLSENLILLEESTNIYELINSLDIYVSSSIKEGFPNILIQTMSCAIPCISTNAGDSKNIIGNAGWVVKVKSPEELSKAIISSMNDDLLSKGQLARERVEEFFGLDLMINRYENIYI